MEIILLGLKEKGYEVKITTKMINGGTFHTIVTAEKNGGQMGFKPIFHKGAIVPEDLLFKKLQDVQIKILKTEAQQETPNKLGFPHQERLKSDFVPMGDIYTPETYPERFNL